jgi:hypothetical protein
MLKMLETNQPNIIYNDIVENHKWWDIMTSNRLNIWNSLHIPLQYRLNYNLTWFAYTQENNIEWPNMPCPQDYSCYEEYNHALESYCIVCNEIRQNNPIIFNIALINKYSQFDQYLLPFSQSSSKIISYASKY